MGKENIFSDLFEKFCKSEKNSGLILIFCTVFSLFFSNFLLKENYVNFWNIKILNMSFLHWINDGLMVIFFLLIGLELKREIIEGELSNIKNASLPIFGAIGGMILPAIFYILFNFNTDMIRGFGIPMATDIAFSIGILSILGNRVPLSLRVFLISLAIIDDLGAIILIAFFYTKSLSFLNIFYSLLIFLILFILNKLKIKNLFFYLIGGLFAWYFTLKSGIHPTISGVLLAFFIPLLKDKNCPSKFLEHSLQKPVSYIILPLFALANTAIFLRDGGLNLKSPLSLGIGFGLLLGKPLGIFLFSYLSSKLKISNLSKDLKWSNILGVGFLGGIGFTMSIFIAILAFDRDDFLNTAKISIILSSTISGIIGFLLLKFNLKKKD